MGLLRMGLQIGLCAGALLIAFATYAILARKPEVVTEEKGAEGKAVQLTPVRRFDTFTAPVISYGTAQAAKSHSIRSLVSGKVERVSDNFQEGRKVDAGEFLFEIDTQDISIAIIEREANLSQATAALGEVDSQFAPQDIEIRRLRQDLVEAQRNIDINQSAINLARSELEREERSFKAGASSQTRVDQAKLALNQREQAVMPFQSQLTQIPILIEQREAQKKSLVARKETLNAQRAVAEAALAKARLDLTRTEVKSPCTGVLLRSTASTKVAAKGDFLGAGEDAGLLILDAGGGIDVAVSVDLLAARWIQGMGEKMTLEQINEVLRAMSDVRVEWFQDPRIHWSGRFDRMKGELDPETRTLTVIIHVADPGSEISLAEEKMPLGVGMYCRVYIPGYVHEDAVVIPRTALRSASSYLVARKRSGSGYAAGQEEDGVLLFEGDDREGVLEGRAVNPLHVTSDAVVIDAKELEPGELLVRTDLPSALAGSKLRVERKVNWAPDQPAEQ